MSDTTTNDTEGTPIGELPSEETPTERELATNPRSVPG